MKSKRGFTFVELIIVAVIIMILAAIAVPNFMEAQTRAVVARTHADLGMVRMTINTYQTEHRKMPQNKEAGVASGWDLVALTTPIPYLYSLPMDPFTLNKSLGRNPNEMPFPPEPFLYFNALQTSDEGLRIVSPNDTGRSGFMAGLLYGHGPFPRFEDQGTSFTSISPAGEARLITYNASNGTHSNGDFHAFLP